MKDDIIASGTGPNPFGAIIAPSGTGKSQLPFVLRSMKMNCLWFNMSVWAVIFGQGQRIYKANMSLSQAFSVALNKDLAELNGERFVLSNSSVEKSHYLTSSTLLTCSDFVCVTPDGKTQSVSDYPLRSIGLIMQLITELVSENPEINGVYDNHRDQDYVFKYEAMSLREFQSATRVFRETESLPIVFLDEFNFGASTADKELKVFTRNLLRQMGLVCFTMGTDSEAATLADDVSLESSISGQSSVIPWVYVIHHLPKATPETIPGYQRFRERTEHLRGWTAFREWMLSLPSTIPLILKVAFEVFAGSTRSKTLSESDYGYYDDARSYLFQILHSEIPFR